MNFSSPLSTAILIRRYKRFLADIMLPNGKIVTIHCANTGAMTGCGAEGDIVWYSTSNNSKRKLPYSWELTVTQEKHWICVNTNKANYIVKEAILQNQIEPLLHYSSVISEVKYGNENSRIDLLLESEEKKKCYVEVKSVTLFESDSCVGYFPDTTTLRGQKHLRELSAMAKNGHRAVIFFLVLHSGIKQFSPAKHIDPVYCTLLENAINDGVEVLCYNAQISTNRITVHHPISIVIA